MTNERTRTIRANDGNGLSGAARTDCGRQREQNEDSYFLDIDAGVFLVVDGVGGHAAGEVAAEIAQDTILKRLERHDATAEVRIREAITLANQQILLEAEASPERAGMACVLTLAVLEGHRLTIGHVGDTRLYRLSPDGIAKMTHDHSPVGEREDAREISEAEAMHHVRRNEVYRDVGSTPREPDAPEFIETVVVAFEDDCAVLLCSDGLSDMLSSVEINHIVRAHAGDPAKVVDALVDAANEAGGKDNITVVYAEGRGFSGTPQHALAPGASTVFRDLVKSRGVALLVGAVIGFGAAFLLTMGALPGTADFTRAPQELIVGSDATAGFSRIGDALSAAHDGDVVRVQPGRYPESLELRRNITLISEEPHAAILVAAAAEEARASVTSWSGKSVIRGFRIAETNAPGHVGIRIHGGDIEIDDMVFDGQLEIGVDAVGEGSRITLRSSRFNRITGVPVQVADKVSVVLRQNLFVSGANQKSPAIVLGATVDPTLEANTFVHFKEPVVGAGWHEAALDNNFVIPPPIPVLRELPARRQSLR